MIEPQEFETRINIAIRAMESKGFVLRRGSYGNERCGCVLTALYFHEVNVPIHDPVPIKKYACSLIGLAAAEQIENGFDRWEKGCAKHEWYDIGVRVGVLYRPPLM